MRRKYPVVTLCGSTRFKTEFYQAQKDLTLQGKIVISVGLFGHSGDNEVWEGMSEGTKTATKYMLDDMHKAKIDMADGIYVVNPGGYIGTSTWSEIYYARITGKTIDSLCPITRPEQTPEIKRAELLAEVRFYCKVLRMNYPEGYPDKISDAELEKFVECWREYDPLPDEKCNENTIPQTYDELVHEIKQYLSSEETPFINSDDFDMDEVNPWTYWQGRGNRSPKILLLGQDWGALNASSLKYLSGIKIVQEVASSEEVHYFDKTKQKMGFATDRNLCDLFNALGYPNIQEKCYEQLFFTNLIPGFRDSDHSSGGYNPYWITPKVKDYFKSLMTILKPQIVICLGRSVYEAVLDIYKKEKPKNEKWTDFLDKFYTTQPDTLINPIQLTDETVVFPVAHPGAYGLIARKKEDQKKDWGKIKTWLAANVPSALPD